MYRAGGDRHASGLALHNLGYVALFQGDLADARRRFEEAATLLEGSGDERHLSLTRSSLAVTCERLGDRAAARGALASALALALSLNAEREAAYALEAAAELAAGDPERAMRWMGCAEALRERIGSPLAPNEREEVEALRDRLGAALGAERAARLRAGGAGTALDAALREALAGATA